MTERHECFRVPESETAARIALLQAALAGCGCSVGWIEHLTDRIYFTGSAQDGVLLVPLNGEPVFLVRKSVARARDESTLRVEPYPGGRATIERVAGMVGDAGLGMALDVTQAGNYVRIAGQVPQIVDIGPAIRNVRSIKSDWEVQQIRAANEQYTRLFDTALDWLSEPITGLELVARVEGRLRSLGHGGTIRLRRPTADIAMANVVSGEVALYPTNFNGCVGGEGPYPVSPASGGWEELTPGTTAMFDIVTSYNGYHADTTRTFYLGRSIPDNVLRAHDFCVDVLREIEQRMVPGAVCSEIYREVSTIVEGLDAPDGFMGFGDNRVKFFGHGVGLDLDELPVLADRIDMTLKEGMIVAVEPKAFLPGVGPVGVENTYVMTSTGCESLCPLDLSLLPVAS
jgi:Xaa-Pro aminopeptidase